MCGHCPLPQEECRELLEARREELDKQQAVEEAAGEEAAMDGEQASNTSSISIESVFVRMRILKKPVCSHDETHPKTLVIDGATLQYALQPSLKLLFLNVAKRCRSVICCRAAPLQKVRCLAPAGSPLSHLPLTFAL